MKDTAVEEAEATYPVAPSPTHSAIHHLAMMIGTLVIDTLVIDTLETDIRWTHVIHYPVPGQYITLVDKFEQPSDPIGLRPNTL